MVDSISQHLVDQFSDMVHHEAQQVKSRMRDKVVTKFVRGRKFSYNNLGSSEAHEVTTRHAKTKVNDIQHSVRWGTMRHFTHTIFLDDFDQMQMLIDPEEGYAQAAARALYRQFDRVALEAVDATITTGVDQDGTLTAAQDGVSTITASSGLTFAKIREAQTNFYNNEVGTDLEERFLLAIGGTQHDELYDESKLSSLDYEQYFTYNGGKVKQALDFEVMIYGNSVANPILPVAGSVRKNYALTDRSICVGISKELDIKVSPRPDLNNLLQIQATMYIGAVRTEGALCQVLNVTES